MSNSEDRYQVNLITGYFEFKTIKVVLPDKRSYWEMTGNFSLWFISEGELNNFCDMRTAQKFEHQVWRVKEDRWILAEEREREMLDPQTYAVNGIAST
jgi:hypothetical protein